TGHEIVVENGIMFLRRDLEGEMARLGARGGEALLRALAIGPVRQRDAVEPLVRAIELAFYDDGNVVQTRVLERRRFEHRADVGRPAMERGPDLERAVPQ